MSRRSKIIVAAVLILALLLLGLWLRLSRRPPARAPVENAPAATGVPPGQGGLINNTGTTTASPPSAAPSAPASAPAKPAPETSLARLAASFAERYGSFSNTGGDFSNVEDLEVFMSAKMMAETDAYVARERSKPAPKKHYGITTRAINETVKLFSEDAGAADIVVKTQRQEFVGNTPVGKVTYKDIRIAFIKENGQWKVDSAIWQ